MEAALDEAQAGQAERGAFGGCQHNLLLGELPLVAFLCESQITVHVQWVLGHATFSNWSASNVKSDEML